MTKSLKFFLFVILFLFSSANQIIFAHNDDDYGKILDGKKFLPHALLNYESLNHFNLNETYFVGSLFCFAELQGVSFVGARLNDCDFCGADLKAANLTEALLCGSILLNANLEDAKVLRANFENVVGLTNNQKVFLRKNGAINVPRDLNKEEFEQELEMIEKWEKQFTLLGQLKKAFKRLFCCCKNNNRVFSDSILISNSASAGNSKVHDEENSCLVNVYEILEIDKGGPGKTYKPADKTMFKKISRAFGKIFRKRLKPSEEFEEEVKKALGYESE